MYNILLVDDELSILNKLKFDITSIVPDVEIDRTTSYNEAQELIQNKSYSIFFLDINLEEEDEKKTGIELAYKIRSIEEYRFTPIVFITTINNKIEEALNKIHCVSYLTKPYTFEQLNSCLNHILTMPELEAIFTNRDVTGTLFKMKKNDIIYLTANKHTVFIYGVENTYELLHYSLDSFQEELGENFIRCHKSYIINKNKILGSYKTPPQLITQLGIIPIGRAYKKNIKEW